MSSEAWEKAVVEKKDGGWLGTVVQIATLGLSGPPEHWEVSYRNRQTGQTVKAIGTTQEEAEARARAQCH
jgi:hypothetical protein